MLKTSAAGAAMAFGAIVAVAAKSLSAWDKQQMAIIQMNNALANQGHFTKAVSLDLQNYAGEIQKTTTLGDEAALAAMSQGAQFGMYGDELKKATLAAANFSAATGRDMATSMGLISKAFVGHTAELTRYGIILDEGIPKNEKFNAVLALMEKRYGGAAAAANETFGGALESISNLLGDVMEGIGKSITMVMGFGTEGGNSLSPVVGALENMNEFFNKWLPYGIALTRKGFETAIGFMIAALGRMMGGLELIPVIGEKFQGINQSLKDMGESMMVNAEHAFNMNTEYINMNQTASQTNQQLQTSAEAIENVGTYTTAALTPLSQFVSMWGKEVPESMVFAQTSFQMTEQEMATLAGTMDMKTLAIQEAFKRMGVTTRADMQATVSQMQTDYETIKNSGLATARELEAAWEKYQTAKMELEGESTAFTLEQNASMVAGALGGFAQLGSKFKVFAIAQAVISTYLAIAKSLASLPWPMNLVAAAGAAAAGFANVAKIKSSKAYRHGTPGLDYTNFGTETPAMLHGKEAVIPQGSGNQLAAEIANAFPTTRTPGLGSVPDFGDDGGGGGEPVVIEIVNMMDGQVLGRKLIPVFEMFSKSGKFRTHTQAVQRY
jgi:hypothetical protein